MNAADSSHPKSALVECCNDDRHGDHEGDHGWGRIKVAGGGTYCGCEGKRAGGRSGTSDGGRGGGLPKMLSKILGNCAYAGEAASRPAIVSIARNEDRAISRLWSAASGCRLRQGMPG